MTSQNVNTDTFSNISIDIETFSDADLKNVVFTSMLSLQTLRYFSSLIHQTMVLCR